MPEPSRAVIGLMAPGEPADVIPRLVGRPAWMERASCRGHPARWWFSERAVERARAVEVCRRCPVRTECLAFALGARDRLVGVWGGTNEGKRRRLRTLKS